MNPAFADWPGVRHYLVTRFPASEFMNDDVLRFPYASQGGEMEIFVRHTVHDLGAAWIYVGSRLAPAPGLDLAALVRRPRPGPVGTLSLALSYLCVGQNLPVRGLRPEHVDWTLDALSSATGYYRSVLGERSQKDLSGLSHLIE